jgi:hypothetical protein
LGREENQSWQNRKKNKNDPVMVELIDDFFAEYAAYRLRYFPRPSINRRVWHRTSGFFLRRTKLSLAEIASICGFTSKSHFTRAIMRAESVGPAGWRDRSED